MGEIVKSETLIKNVEKYKKCKTELSPTDYKKEGGKYKKAYDKLIKDIKEEMLSISKEFIFSSHQYLYMPSEEKIQKIQNFINLKSKKLSKIIFVYMDVDMFYDELIEINKELDIWI